MRLDRNERNHLMLRKKMGCIHNNQNKLKLGKEKGDGCNDGRDHNDRNHLKLRTKMDAVIMTEIT